MRLFSSPALIMLASSILAVESLIAPRSTFVRGREYGRSSSVSVDPRFEEELTRTQTTSLEALALTSVVEDVANAYSYALTNYELQTETVTGGVLCGVGDVMAQTREGATNKFNDIVRRLNVERTRNFALKGLGSAVMWSFWYTAADQMSASMCQSAMSQLQMMGVEGMGDNTEAILRTVSSIALEQFIWCPVVYSLWDIPVPALLSGAPLKSVPEQVTGKLGGLLIANAKVWTFINLVIYNIPLEWRVVVSCVTDLFWQSVVSTVAFKENIAETETEVSTELLQDGPDRPSLAGFQERV